MLNMKKGLAIVLAAATALTFAPVSTLGLTGVVEAKAATTTAIEGASDAAGTAFPATADILSGDVGTWDAATNAKAFADATADVTQGEQYFIVEITGAAQGDEYTINTDDANGVVERYAAGESGPNKGQEKVKLDSSDKAKVVFHALKKGTGKVTITNGTGASAKVLTLNFTVAGNASSVKFKDGTKAIDKLNLYAQAADTDKIVTLDFGTSENGNHYAFNLDKTNSIKFKSGTTPDTDAKVSGGQATVTLQYSKASTNTLYVYGSEADAKAKKNPIGSLKINVLSTDFGVTAQNLTIGTAGRFSYTSKSTITPAVNITDANNKDVTSDFQIDEGTDATDSGDRFTSTSTTKANSVNYIWVTPVDATAGSYKVTLTQGSGATAKTVSATFTVSTAASSTDRNNTDADKSDVYGGVKDAIIATDNTTYSLVSSDVSFNIDRTNYTADQLKWYLTETPSTTPVNMGFTQGSAVITESGANGVGKLSVKVANAHQFAIDTRNAHIVGVYTSGAVNKIVYNKAISVTGADAGVATVNYDAGTIATDEATVNAKTTDGDPLSKDFLNGIQFIGTNNKKLNGANSTVEVTPETNIKGGINFTAGLKDYIKDDGNAAKDSILYKKSTAPHLGKGVYYETYYVPYTDDSETETTKVKFIAQINLTVSVNAGPSIEVREGNYVYSSTTQTPVDKKVIDLDLATNKTFDLASHIYSNKDNTSYSYDVDTLNVTVSDKGVVTASKVGTAVVKITPKANGVSGAPVYVFFRVNANSDDQITVTGKDGDKATVLSTRQYNGNSTKLSTEEALAAAQVGYDQIEVTGDETADVKEPLTVKGTGNLSYALATAPKHGESIDPKTGVVTIPHSYLNDKANWTVANTTPTYVFPVKVVSTETKTSALTTGYFYVVVDFADATVNGLQSSYDLGTSGTKTDEASWLNLGLNKAYGPVHVSSNTGLTTTVLTKNNQLDNSTIYNDDDSSAFDNGVGGLNYVARATVAGKTEHLLITAGNAAQKIGNTYKVVTVKSVAGQKNYVTKITDAATGKTIYETNGVTSGASIVIDKTTVVKVSVAHTPAASLNPKYDPAFTISDGNDEFNYNPLHYFVAATENPKTYEVTLIPSQEGTQIVSINPTQGRLSETDYSLVGNDYTMLAVKYDTTPVPAKVTGLKIANKKGAAVKVTWKSQGSGIKYRVYKKVGNGDWVAKNVSSSSTSLKVKKGAKVTVKVKAYAKSSTNKTIWGPKATKASKKTDKK